MKKEQKRKLFRIWDILLSVLLVITGICLMVQCYRIYRGGAYTPETVAAAFRPIRGVVYACAAMILLRLAGCLFEDEAPKKAQRQLHMVYARAAARADVENCPEKEQILALRKARKLGMTLGWVLFGICALVFLSYALQSKNFGEDVTASMIPAAWLLLGTMLVPFLWAVVMAYRNRRSMERELELLKKAPKAEMAAEKMKNYVPALRSVLLVLAVLLVAVGLNLGGTRDVLTKAINICTECVGLG